MIDLAEMEGRQKEGAELLDALQGDEKDVLQHYCSLVTEALLKEGALRKVPVDRLVANAYRFGIALGTRLKITGGELLGR